MSSNFNWLWFHLCASLLWREKVISMCHLVDPWSQSWIRELTFWLPETQVNHLQWESLDFHLNLRNFDPRYLGGTRELKALLLPIDSTHGHYGSWKYELSAPSASGRTKNRCDLGKTLVGSRPDSHCDLVAGRSVHGPNFETMDLRDGTWKSLFLFTLLKHKGGTITS